MPYRVTVREPLVVLAPAKLNLGLEVLGKRPDGYHDLVTILQTIDLSDRLVLEPAPRLTYQPPSGMGDEVVARALRSLAEKGVVIEARLSLEKRIPVAAGLGGGSSDAGTLLGAFMHAGLPRSLATAIATQLGSDVPFFLDGGTALARGRGTDLEPLPPPSGWFVLVVPELTLTHKTRQLYAALTPADYSDGLATLRQAERLRLRQDLDPQLVRNAFLRPLLAFEAVRRTLDAFTAAGARWAWPSGSGPAVFTWCPRREAAEQLTLALERSGLRPILTVPLQPSWEQVRAAITVEQLL